MTNSQPNLKALIQHHYDEWSSGNAAGVAECYAENCVFEDVTLETKADGRRAVEDLVVSVCEAIPDLKWHVGLIAVDGETCACELRFEGTLKKDLPGIPATGGRIDVRELSLLIIRDAKIQEYRGYWSMGMLLRQLGHVIRPG